MKTIYLLPLFLIPTISVFAEPSTADTPIAKSSPASRRTAVAKDVFAETKDVFALATTLEDNPSQ